jgi:hypothetical protein
MEGREEKVRKKGRKKRWKEEHGWRAFVNRGLLRNEQRRRRKRRKGGERRRGKERTELERQGRNLNSLCFQLLYFIWGPGRRRRGSTPPTPPNKHNTHRYGQTKHNAHTQTSTHTDLLHERTIEL